MEQQIVSKKIFELFKQYRNQKFIFVDPRGNFGDELIFRGARKLAKLAGLDFESVSHQQFLNSSYSSEAVIYIQGGGGFNSFWTSGVVESFIKALEEHEGVIIQGPQSFANDPHFIHNRILKYIPQRQKKVFIFARALVSYNIIRDIFPKWINIDIDHDTAFNLTAGDLISFKPKRRYDLYSIRTDREKVEYDFREYLTVWLDPVRYCDSFEQWVNLHNYAKKIITNRAHSAILGSILGIPTVMLPNNYHKNWALWEYSLKERGVEWEDAVKISKVSSIIHSTPPLKWLCNSYKFQTLIRSLAGVPT